MTASTIFALASGSPPAGLAVVRVSGDQAGMALAALLGPAPMPEPRRARVARLVHPTTAEPLDDALVLWFPAPASFTGEDVAELHLHGGRAVVAGVLDALASIDGLRMAEPGEYARRAFDNGKLDLTQAEGLADLIDAETDAQKRQALRQAGGALARLYDGWRERLLAGLAHFEAAIDFSDEDLPAGVADAVRADVRLMADEINQHLDAGVRAERLRDGLHLAILGAPNAGKSSLLNALARRDAAIVSETAGTTRDVVEVHLDIGGWPVVVADTAGLRTTSDTIEQEGVRRAQARAEQADLKICVFDATELPALDDATRAWVDGNAWVVFNKMDAAKHISAPADVVGACAGFAEVSAKTGAGIDGWVDALAKELAARVGPSTSGGGAAPTRLRHREGLRECADSLHRFLQTDNAELAAEDLRLAMRALGRLTGRVGVEDLLDVIFADFCIGK